MADLSGFDANLVEPNKGLEPIPPGDYVAVITASEMKKTSLGTGQFLALTFEVIEGEYSKRKLFSNLNLSNPNEQTVQIARGDMSAICRAVGVLQPKDSSEMHNKPLLLRVTIEKRKDTGGLQNRITSYKPRSGTTPSGPATVPPAAGAPPWQR